MEIGMLNLLSGIIGHCTEGRISLYFGLKHLWRGSMNSFFRQYSVKINLENKFATIFMVFSFEIAFARGIFLNPFQFFIALTLPNCTLVICNYFKVLHSYSLIFFPFKDVFQKSVACWDHHEMEIWYVITMPLEMETLWELIANSVVMQATDL